MLSNFNLNKLINYSTQFTGTNLLIIFQLIWIYKFVFNLEAIIVLPKFINIFFYDSLLLFNESIDKAYQLTEVSVLANTLENIEQITPNKKQRIIFPYFHVTYGELCNINKRRINTLINQFYKKGITHIFSLVPIPCLPTIQDHSNDNLINLESMFNKFSFIDFDENSISEFVETIVNSSKRVYLSLNFKVPALKQIENTLITSGITVGRSDNPDTQVVINSSKTTCNTILANEYQAYIIIAPNDINGFDILRYLVFLGHDSEIYVEETFADSLNELLNTKQEQKLSIRDSNEYESYELLFKQLNKLGVSEPVSATEAYYRFNGSLIKNLDLSNLKNDNKNRLSIYEYIKSFFVKAFDRS
jgi:hypothetical protein